jgi:hypothetical protein
MTAAIGIEGARTVHALSSGCERAEPQGPESLIMIPPNGPLRTSRLIHNAAACGAELRLHTACEYTEG